MNDKPSFEKTKLTPLESIGIGAVTGFSAVTVYLPTWAIKMRMQCGLPFTLDPRFLYKGYTTGLSVMVPATAFEMFNTSRVESISSKKTVTAKERVVSSFLGGLTSSILTNPLNLIGTQQHKHNTTPYKVISIMVRQHGLRSLFIGLPTIAVADGMFNCAFYGLFPPVKYYLTDYTCNNETFAGFAASALIGIPTAALTHPIDLIKTRQHQYADEKGMHGFTKCFKEIYKSNTKMAFFKAFVPRTIGMTCTVLAAGTTAEVAESLYRKTL